MTRIIADLPRGVVGMKLGNLMVLAAALPLIDVPLVMGLAVGQFRVVLLSEIRAEAA
jgi:hypothetical protein